MKKIIIIFGISLLLIIIGLFTAAEIFEDKIGNTFKNSINSSLKSAFHFDAFDLSMVRNFPYATIRFQDAYLLDINGDTLLQANKVHFKLDLFSLLKSQIEVKATSLEKGQINISIDKNGIGNYNILTSTTPTSDRSDPALAIEEASIKNMDINYKDASSKSSVHLWADDLLLEVQLLDKIDISLLGTLRSKLIDIDNVKYLINQNLSVNCGLGYERDLKILSINDGEIGVEGMVIYADGSITYNDDHEIYDLVLTNNDGNLESMFRLLPDKQVEEFKKLTSSGDFDLSVFYKGKKSKYSNPEMQCELHYDRGRIVIPQFGIPLKNVAFSAKYLDKSKKGLTDAGIQISGFQASLDGEKITGDMAYDNFDNPYLKLNAQGKMPIQTVLDITGIDAADMEGNLDFNKLKINGLLRDLSSPMNQGRTLTEADVDLHNISFAIDGKEILLQDGRLVGEKDYFELKDLQIRLPKSVFQLNGYLKRLVPFVFAEFQRPDVQFDLDVRSATCDLSEVMDLANSQMDSDPKIKQVASTSTESYIGAMNGDVNITIDKFQHTDMKGTDFKGHLSFYNNSILIKGAASGMKGSFDLEGMLTRKNNKDHIEAKVIANEVDVNSFFSQTKDFGQATLQAKHLKGRLNTQLLISGDWNEDGTFNRKGLHVLGSAQILNGELINFKLMENFSSYVKSEDLNHIKFGSLDNYFEIKNEVIHIPTMFVQSNAVNLTMSGEHAFNNAIDYNIKVNAGQVLTNKLKKYNPTLSPIPARKKGFFNLYYAIKGTVDDPSYKTSKRQVKSDFVISEYQKSIIKKQLDRAFPQQLRFNINTIPEEIQDKNIEFIESEEGEFLDPIKAGGNN